MCKTLLFARKTFPNFTDKCKCLFTHLLCKTSFETNIVAGNVFLSSNGQNTIWLITF